MRNQAKNGTPVAVSKKARHHSLMDEPRRWLASLRTSKKVGRLPEQPLDAARLIIGEETGLEVKKKMAPVRGPPVVIRCG